MTFISLKGSNIMIPIIIQSWSELFQKVITNLQSQQKFQQKNLHPMMWILTKDVYSHQKYLICWCKHGKTTYFSTILYLIILPLTFIWAWILLYHQKVPSIVLQIQKIFCLDGVVKIKPRHTPWPPHTIGGPLNIP